MKKLFVCFLSFLMMLSFLPASVSVKAEGTVEDVTIIYDESQVTLTTSMTSREATALLVNALEENAGSSAYADKHTDVSYLAKREGNQFLKISGEELLKTEEEYYFCINVENREGYLFSEEEFPHVTINGKDADHITWFDAGEPDPDSSINVYIHVYVEGQVRGHRISFLPGEGKGNMPCNYIRDGVNFRIPECPFTGPVGYRFSHWSIPGSDKKWRPGDILMEVKEDKVLTANWEYGISAKIEDDILSWEPVSGAEYYFFSPGFNLNQYLPKDAGPIDLYLLYSKLEREGKITQGNQSITLMAVDANRSAIGEGWVQIYHYYPPTSPYAAVFFDANGASGPDLTEIEPVRVPKDTAYSDLWEGENAVVENMTDLYLNGAEGKMFLSWSLTSQAEDEIPFSHAFNENTVLYAKWANAIEKIVLSAPEITAGMKEADYDYNGIKLLESDSIVEMEEDFLWTDENGDTFEGTFEETGYYLYIPFFVIDDSYAFPYDYRTGEALFKTIVNGKEREVILSGDPKYLKVRVLFDLSVQLEAIGFEGSMLKMEVGETKTLTPEFKPADARVRHLTWFSDDPSIADVDQDGNVTAYKEGYTHVNVTSDNGVTGSCYIDVNRPKVHVQSITLDRDTMTLIEGESERLEVTILPEKAEDKGVTWSSSNNAVAYVDGSGLVMSRSKGKAVITATADDNGLSATCEVTVTGKYNNVSFSLGPHGSSYGVKVEDGETVPRPEDPKAEGYIFKGWYTDGAFTQLYDFDEPVYTSFTLYARFDAAVTAHAYPEEGGTVQLDEQMEGAISGPAEYADAQSFTLKAVPAEGYRFLYWTKGSPEGNQVSSDAVFIDYAYGPADYYAVFEKNVGKHQIRFFGNGGEGIMPSVMAEEGKEYTLPECGFTYGNSTFKGWDIYDTEGKQLYSDKKPGETITVEEDLDIYADWKRYSSVIRLSGRLRYDTSLVVADELKSVLGIEKFDTVILATGEDFADALGGGYLAAKKNAPIILTKPTQKDKANKYINENLTDNGTVYVLGGEGAVPASCLEGLNTSNIVRLSGRNRYVTNLAILNEAGVDREDILIVTGTNYADSLAASATGLPMLLVNGKNTSLNDGQRSFLSTHSSNTFYIIGGTGAVSSEIETDISSINTVNRLSGRLRFDTSVLIAETFFSDPEKVILSYSHNFPDGLSGGPLAYALKSPVLLTRANSEKAALDYVSSHSITSGYLCGGEKVLPDTTARIIFSLPEDQEIEKR